MIKIYGPRVSSFVNKVLAAADYKRLDYQHQENISVAQMFKLNPIHKKVPIAEFDGEVVYDSSIILDRFDEVSPKRPLLSSDKSTAVQQRILEDWGDECFYWYMMSHRWSPSNRARGAKQNSVFLPAILRPLAKTIFYKMYVGQIKSQGLGRFPEEVMRQEFGDRLDHLCTILKQNDFFYSDTPSIADFSIYGAVVTGCNDATTPDFHAAFKQRPELVSWRERLEKEMGPRRSVEC